jgi:hypothetical protein
MDNVGIVVAVIPERWARRVSATTQR